MLIINNTAKRSRVSCINTNNSTSCWSCRLATDISAFTRGHMLPDTSCIHLYPLVAVNMFLNCIGRQNCRQFVGRLLQRDTSRPRHKWIVIMLPRYSLQVFGTSNLYPSTYMYPDTSCSSTGIHVSGRHVSWWKRGNTDYRCSRRWLLVYR